jgi:hypothetical protein
MLINSPQIGMARSQTLAALQPYMAAMLTDEMLKTIDSDLAAIPARQ